ncbi:PDZ domain-containing protein [Ammoniphilus resinae]|nr:PDZ domain-containing protein [Ammoniphilus resinae]
MQYRRQTLFERRLFSVRVHNPWEQFIESVAQGLGGGIIISLLTIAMGIVIQPTQLFLLCVISFLLACYHIQYLCYAYSGGVLSLLALIAKTYPQGEAISWLRVIWKPLVSLEFSSLFAFIAILHLLESYLLLRNSGKDSSPLLVNGKRGMLVGVHQIQKFWLAPVFVVAAVPPELAMPVGHPSWWPLFSTLGTGFTILLFPVVIGHTTLAISSLPSHKIKRVSKQLIYYSFILFGLAWGIQFWGGAGILAAFWMILGHEAIMRIGNWLEWKRPLLFVPRPEGVVVLAVIANSPAAEMGIEVGDVLQKINGIEIHHPDEVYPALRSTSTFCKMEVLNEQGHIKYLQRTIYQGEHHELGLIFAPDEQSEYYVDLKPISIVQLIRQQIQRGA